MVRIYTYNEWQTKRMISHRTESHRLLCMSSFY